MKKKTSSVRKQNKFPSLDRDVQIIIQETRDVEKPLQRLNVQECRLGRMAAMSAIVFHFSPSNPTILFSRPAPQHLEEAPSRHLICRISTLISRFLEHTFIAFSQEKEYHRPVLQSHEFTVLFAFRQFVQLVGETGTKWAPLRK